MEWHKWYSDRPSVPLDMTHFLKKSPARNILDICMKRKTSLVSHHLTDHPLKSERKEILHGSENPNMFLSYQFLRSYLNSTKAPLRHPIWAEPFQQSWADEATRTTRISRNAFRYLRVLVGLALRATRAPKLTGRPGFPWYLE